jgi:hypothetical protein
MSVGNNLPCPCPCRSGLNLHSYSLFLDDWLKASKLCLGVCCSNILLWIIFFLLRVTVFTSRKYLESLPFWSSHHILTASRRNAIVYPWMTVGMPVPSSTSLAICAQHMAVCRKTLPTNTALMTFATHWYSSAPLRC